MKKTTVTIKQLPNHDRPRERLIAVGAERLSDEELVAILLNSGTFHQSSKNLAADLLKNIHGLETLEIITYPELIQMKGIGPAKACTLLAIAELIKRIEQRHHSLDHVTINRADLVYGYYRTKLGMELQESFYCLYLNQRKKLLCEKQLFIGTLNQSLVHPREIFKEAYLQNASAIICVHNHPSGSVLPSNEDLITTEQIKKAGILLGIPLIDHVIVGRECYYSFMENGQI